MSCIWLLAVSLSGPLPLPPVVAPVLRADVTTANRDSWRTTGSRVTDEFRKRYRTLLHQSALKARPNFATVVPELATLYTDLASATGFAHAETVRMQRRLKFRMQQIRDRLIRGKRRRQRDAKQFQRRSHNRQSRPVRGTLTGRAEIANANRLIDLIQTTIAPDSWEVNGGRGSIRYYDPLQVLVVRQTGEIHHQIGGNLIRLRK